MPVPPGGFDAVVLHDSLVHFARDWLQTLSGETSVALNRLAVGEAGTQARILGRIVLENGPSAMRSRLAPVLEAGRAAGLLVFEDADEAFRVFFGLVVRDLQIRMLLGDLHRPSSQAIDRDAARATTQFFALYGADRNEAGGRPRQL